MFDEEFFEVTSSSNGTHHVVKALRRGSTRVHGSFDTVVLPVNNYIIKKIKM